MHHLRLALRGHRKARGRGLVTRKRSETDRRQLTVHPHARGRRRAREVLRTRRAFEGRAFDCLEPSERERLAETLDRIAARWEELERGEKDEKTEKGDGR